ncbi:MAG: hypothetical protein IKR25_13100 [Muribaculaceae bacterium]|nr:hypothetical protein [Muribaculaceae bacterium]
MTPWLIHSLPVLALVLSCCVHDDTSVPIDTQALQAGDLVVRRGLSVASRAVLAADSAATYSHMGIVVWRNGQWMVAHAVPGERDDGGPDTVKMDPLTHFFLPVRAARGAVARVQASPSSRQRAANEAIAVVARHTPFDHHYNLHDTTALYCTELVIRCYAAAGINLEPTQLRHVSLPGFEGDYAFPSQVLDNPKVTIIMNY